MACALDILRAHWTHIRRAGPPDDLPDSGNTSPRTMMLAPHWTAP